MALAKVDLPEKFKGLAEARASATGFDNVSDYLVHLISGEAAGLPDGLDPEVDVESILVARASGPFVDMDAADFKNMRAKLRTRLADEGVE